MGYATLADLRLQVAQHMGKVGYGWCTSASSSGSTSFFDTTTPERYREQADFWNGGTLLVRQGTSGPSEELLSESAIEETETSGAVVTPASTDDPLDATCIKIVTSSTAGSSGVASFPVTTTAGTTVEVSFWCKGDGTVCGRWGFRASEGASTDVVGTWSSKGGEPTYVTGEKWTRILRRIRVPTSATECTLDLYSSTELSKTVYFDKPSVRTLGETRYISDYANGGTFTVASLKTALSTAYEAYYKDFTIEDYRQAVNHALRVAYPYLFEVDEDQTIETTSGDASYDIPDNIDPDEIFKVEIEDDTSEDTAPYTRHVFWKIRKLGQTAKLQFTHDEPGSGRNVRLYFIRPLSPLESDFDTVDAKYLPYIIPKAKAFLYEMLLGKTTRSDRVQVGENADYFHQEAAAALKQLAMQRPATHIKPQWPGFH